MHALIQVPKQKKKKEKKRLVKLQIQLWATLA
jgi:hypothetical protein